MKKQIALTDQLAEIDVDSPSEAVPAREAFFLVALDVPQGIANILETELDSTLQQARPLAGPLSEEMAVRALSGFMAVRPAECFLLRNLGICGSGNDARAEQQEENRWKLGQGLTSDVKKGI